MGPQPRTVIIEWIGPAISIAGSVLGSYVGVRVAITRLDVEVSHWAGLTRAHDDTLDNLADRLKTAEGDLERMKEDIGTHDTGLRGAVHAHSNVLSQHELRLHALDKQAVRDIAR